MSNLNHPHQWTRIAAIAVMALFGCIAVFAQDDDPPPQAGRLSTLSGSVSIQPAGSDDWGQAYANLPLGPGDRIVTDQDGRAEIQLARTWVRIGPNTDITMVEASDNALTFGLAQGTAIARTRGLSPDQSLYVQTPSGTVTLIPPSSVRVDVLPADQTAVFSDRWGAAYVSGAGDYNQQISQGQTLELTGTNPVIPQWYQPVNTHDDLQRWNDERDAMIDRAKSWQYVSPEIPGGEALDAAGEWAPESDYGAVWYPRVDAGWAPYRNGHWANREPWGWIWVEDESWGYAPFHFGRWVNISGRWGWIPGPREAHPVWSPALVVFVGGQPGMSGWIPLGPGEAYKPWYRCSSRYVDRVNISNIRPARRVVVQKTYVNINVTNVNITYVNRTSVTVVRQDDFNSGRPVARAAVHVDPARYNGHVDLIAPPAPAKRPSIVSAPVARPVHVAEARPVMINAKGQTVAAQVHAQPVATPVKPVAAPKPVAGRTVAAPPPNAKPQPAQPGAQPVAQPGVNRPANQPPAALPQGKQEPFTRQSPQPKANQQPLPGNQQPPPPGQAQPKTNQPPVPQQGQPKPNQPAAPAAQQQPPQGRPATPPPAQPKPNQPPAPAVQPPPSRTPPPGQQQPNANQPAPKPQPPAQNRPPVQTQPKPNQPPAPGPKPNQPPQPRPQDKDKDKNKKQPPPPPSA